MALRNIDKRIGQKMRFEAMLHGYEMQIPTAAKIEAVRLTAAQEKAAANAAQAALARKRMEVTGRG